MVLIGCVCLVIGGTAWVLFNSGSDNKANGQMSVTAHPQYREFSQHVDKRGDELKTIENGFTSFLEQTMQKCTENEGESFKPPEGKKVGETVDIPKCMTEVLMLAIQMAKSIVSKYHQYYNDVLIREPDHKLTKYYKSLLQGLQFFGNIPETCTKLQLKIVKEIPENPLHPDEIADCFQFQCLQT